MISDLSAWRPGGYSRPDDSPHAPLAIASRTQALHGRQLGCRWTTRRHTHDQPPHLPGAHHQHGVGANALALQLRGVGVHRLVQRPRPVAVGAADHGRHALGQIRQTRGQLRDVQPALRVRVHVNEPGRHVEAVGPNGVGGAPRAEAADGRDPAFSDHHVGGKRLRAAAVDDLTPQDQHVGSRRTDRCPGAATHDP